MISDASKGITSISYNYQNKPATIILTGNKEIRYLYDGAGNKLKMTTLVNGVVQTTTDYLGGAVIENNVL